MLNRDIDLSAPANLDEPFWRKMMNKSDEQDLTIRLRLLPVLEKKGLIEWCDNCKIYHPSEKMKREIEKRK